jgi:hypothetical protein
MLPPNAVELTQAALLASYWTKKALRRFLRRMHVSDAALAHLNDVQTKRDFLDWLFEQLEKNDRGKSLVRDLANELSLQTRFPDLEGWEDSEIKKARAAEAVKALRDWLDAEAEEKEDAKVKRARREACERDRLARTTHDRNLANLQDRLDSLALQIGTQEGGYAFQDWFGELCALFEMDYKKSYRSAGRETDGSLTIGDMTFLLSLKFEAKQTAPGDVDELKGRLHKVADYTMGILLSMSGFGATAIATASGAQTSTILLDHSHLYYILSGVMSLGDVITRIRRHASRTGEAYLAVQRFGI